jgi:hypothetical protein
MSSMRRFVTAATVPGLCVLVLSACGSNGATTNTITQSPASLSSQVRAMLSFSTCMRAHGVRNFPDPNSKGVFPPGSLRQLGVGSVTAESALSDCKSLLPGNTTAPSVGSPATSTQLLRFSACMRTHGVPNFPDIGPGKKVSLAQINQQSPQFIDATRACSTLLPHGGAG